MFITTQAIFIAWSKNEQLYISTFYPFQCTYLLKCSENGLKRWRDRNGHGTEMSCTRRYRVKAATPEMLLFYVTAFKLHWYLYFFRLMLLFRFKTVVTIWGVGIQRSYLSSFNTNFSVILMHLYIINRKFLVKVNI